MIQHSVWDRWARSSRNRETLTTNCSLWVTYRAKYYLRVALLLLVSPLRLSRASSEKWNREALWGLIAERSIAAARQRVEEVHEQLREMPVSQARGWWQDSSVLNFPTNSGIRNASGCDIREQPFGSMGQHSLI
jgi:hypothetical protein